MGKLGKGKSEMNKTKVAQVREKYEQDFKLKAVRLVNSGQSVPVKAKKLDMSAQTLGTWAWLSSLKPVGGW